METYDWESVGKQCSNLLHEFVPKILAATGQGALSSSSSEWFTQMASFVIPTDAWQGLKTKLYDDYKIEALTIWWNNRTLLRISVNAYNNALDLEHLVAALQYILAQSL